MAEASIPSAAITTVSEVDTTATGDRSQDDPFPQRLKRKKSFRISKRKRHSNRVNSRPANINGALLSASLKGTPWYWAVGRGCGLSALTPLRLLTPVGPFNISERKPRLLPAVWPSVSVSGLEYDQDRMDRYGRTLAYVFLVDGTFLNAEIIKQGYGFAYTRFPFKHLEAFRKFEREARENGRGQWAQP